MRSSYGQSSQRSRRGLGLPAALAAVALLLAIVVAETCRPLPALSAEPMPPTIVASAGATPPWPTAGAAALGLAEGGIIGVANDNQALPLASVTKVMTAVVILDSHPLKVGEPGPTITISHADVAEYLREAGEDQSVVSVAEGEQITELQLLQGLLIPSGNNLADLLARWDAGSMDAFVAKMNAKAASLGMTKTKYADASGISPASIGAASDQVKLALEAMRNPVFAQIVGIPSADLPVAGTVKTTNKLLGSHEIVGIKTGNTDEAGGCFVFASMPEINGQRRLLVGAVLGQKDLDAAFTASAVLADASPQIVRAKTVLNAGTKVGTITAPWGQSTEVRPTQDITTLVWPGAQAQNRVELAVPPAPIAAGAQVGTVTVELGAQRISVPLKAVSAIQKPSFFWKLFRH